MKKAHIWFGVWMCIVMCLPHCTTHTPSSHETTQEQHLDGSFSESHNPPKESTISQERQEFLEREVTVERIESHSEANPKPDSGELIAESTEPHSELPPELPVAECGTTRSFARGEKRWTLKQGSITRSFYVHIPPQYDGNKAYPVIFNFHGVNSNAIQHQWITSLNKESKKRGFISVHPEGRGIPQSWNAKLCCAPSYNVLFSKDVDFVRAMIQKLRTTLCIDTKRIYAMGLSNGALMSIRLGCELSGQIAAIGSVAGTYSMSSCTPKRPVPVIAFHGTADLVVPFAGNPWLGYPSVRRMINGWVKHNQCKDHSKRVFEKSDTYCDEYNQCTQKTPVRLCVTRSGGHTWPGGVPIPAMGKTTYAIRATEAIVNFFLQHKLP